MGNLSKQDLYPHLTSDYLKENEKFNSKYNFADLASESDKINHKRLNDEADVLNPLTALGWRSSDIDSLQLVQDARLQNILIARLQPLGNEMVSNLTDEQLVETVIRRNLTSSEVSDLQNEYDYLRTESDRLYNEFIERQQSENDYVPETKE